MKLASISNTKNHLSSYIDEVKSGQVFLITDHNKPVAFLTPVEKIEDDQMRLDQLQRSGMIKIGSNKVDCSIFDQLASVKGEPISQTLINDRENDE